MSTNASEIYKLWLKPHHLPESGADATIERATVETLHPRPGQTEQRLVLAFKGKNRRLILNGGNVNKLVDLAEDDFGKWVGLTVRLKPATYGSKPTIVIEPGKAANGQHAN